MQEFLNEIYLNNTVLNYLWSLGSFFVSCIIIKVLQFVILNRMNAWKAKRPESNINNVILGIKKYLLPLMYLGAFYLSIKILYITPLLSKIIDIIVLALITMLTAIIATSSLEYSLYKYSQKINSDSNKQFALHWMIKIIKGIIWSVALILFIQNIGIDITALVAGLGIGGVAIAFAAQAILEDVFSYFTIFLDRPFEIGDFIILGDDMGTVEHIGIRTTRLHSLGGEQLIFPNNDLTSSRVRNYKRMEQRRILFTLTVIYDTPLELLKEIPKLMQSIIESQPDTLFDRAHFFAYDNSSLNYEIVYYVLSSEYNKYMDIQQEINFNIKEEFDKLGIHFAYPTQTLNLHSSTFAFKAGKAVQNSEHYQD